MFTLVGNCIIDVCSYVTNIPIRIEEKRQQEEVKRLELMKINHQMIIPVLNELIRVRTVEDEIRYKLAEQSLVRDKEVKVQKFKDKRINGLMQVAESYRHHNITDKTRIMFKGESYLLKPLLHGKLEDIGK